ncbi:MAG: tRNA pseudouridine(38-40) synthase TruA [Acidobacteriia bacterium]|nr:tRNA pseudouridine(38-40) synthase TruA [Terriglobia bacterium]
MRNIKLTLAYDGTDFSGWQIQPGQATVQGTLAEVIAKLTRSQPTIYGAGRTDAGVHAAGQVANFKTESSLPPEEFLRACNALLPPSIRVIASEEAAPDFHARWNALAKTYRYRIFRTREVPPFIWRYVHQDSSPLDFVAMAEAARRFEGEHDFTTFAASTGSEEDDRERVTTRTIYRSELVRCMEQSSGVQAPHEEWVYVVRGKSFLRYMVRIIVGTLVDVGRGKLNPADIPALLALRDRSKSGPTMPPQGLCMAGVEYEKSAEPAGHEDACSTASQ